jgi:dipeptidyl aminopeptidase/acylaminoacyl peptidase
VVDENPRNAQLWLVRADGAKPEVKRTAASVTAHIGAFDWSPDSRKIVFDTRPTPDADDGRHADLHEVDIETGKVRVLAATGATEAQPRYSPDGRYVAFTRSPDPPNGIRGTRIALLDLKSGRTRDQPATYDETPNLVDWAQDSLSIFFTEGRGTRAVLYAMPVDGPPQTVWAPQRGTFGFGMNLNVRGTHAGFTFQTPSDPPEAYVLALGSNTLVRVSAANSGLSLPPVGETRVVSWKSKDGREIEGLLTLPPGYTPGKRVPLILNIHGGPAGAFNESFVGSLGIYPIAAFASRGWATLRPNPRGSTAYGLRFRAANLNDWGGGDYQDLMTGVDWAIQQGIADPEKLAVMGWSYGGYMTNWVVTQTGRFKAAASGAGLSNLISMWGTNDIPSTLDDYFEGPWWERTNEYLRMSPLTHVDKVTTPLLILHGEQDIRVPLGQGTEMYYSVKRKGVPAEMVVYPRMPHGPQEPKFMLDIMKRHIDWVAKYLGE